MSSAQASGRGDELGPGGSNTCGKSSGRILLTGVMGKSFRCQVNGGGHIDQSAMSSCHRRKVPW